MSMQLKNLPFDAEAITNFTKNRNEPKWFSEIRLKGLGLAEELPLPTPEKTRIADWNFTKFNVQTESGAVDQLSDLPEEISNLMGKGDQVGNVLIHVNNSAVFDHLSQNLKDQGVIYTDLATAVREHSDLLANYYFKTTSIDKHQLTALNAALVNGGTFLYVPKNVVVSEPIQAVYYQDAPEAGLIAHTLVVAEESSSVTFVESYLSDAAAGKSVANIVNEVVVGANAQVNYGAVDEFSDQFVTYVSRQANVAKDGRIQWALGQMNDGNTLSENATNLEGDGAEADIKAVSIGSGSQKQNFDNYVRHVGKATKSQLLVRAAQKDASNSIFNARTKIEHGASGADGEQTQRVLMLSDQARGDANPILLIDEYDVIAGHAASVGRVDPDQLYYLMSRGIKQETAEKLIVEGFLAPVVDLLPVAGVQKQLTKLIERKVG
ncbi:Fe-S cluster assembly protein SufD [Sporolactobacillus terrae]|uniref:Fe-S cluster assembly protein SufD n=1 Tax=Sporolactobacillus terrae TaxID=269673 RepID=A0A410D7P1_9BACL|nr:Fe-S cluster assembly protein SufD [Sporolactobacillus terrae]QAA22088.1 Fe-S cluster assembly protein SufD [Sporolactobacillus terrae]QAA25060.1 Fe-S cluster assembly protein SufD [Sporolactobacillus terrae]UAK16883.1 Fe-S cluster assembly protein SufD [Sporolactobacillus terrae]BBN98380.1 FeS cluster assembly protein SufD [Sporolactobacillus terrae]